MTGSAPRLRIAIVGTGISGMLAAWLLHRDHEITVFEAAGYVGGHTHTVDVERGGETHSVDTGFIVYNERNYPNFTRLLAHLGVETQPSDMSFSVRSESTGLEYNGTSLDTLFAQRRNLFRPSFLRMIRDILRFNREAPGLLTGQDDTLTLGAYLAERCYSRPFVEHYIVPMGSAIWSAPPDRMLEFPARRFVEFFRNHGFLSVGDRPLWRVVRGGSRRYVEALTRPYRDRIRLKTPVARVRRFADRVELAGPGGPAETFDQVVIAAHGDQALAMLADPTPEETATLGAIRYQANDVALHTDARLLPRRPRARASWNYLIPREKGGPARVTYSMTRLQRLATTIPFCVTLNRTESVDPAAMILRLTYEHPVHDRETFAAQRKRAEIGGGNRTHYCGAYWGFGFHEDGVNSALAVGRAFGRGLPS
jgi:predicted NAD/FAD-binding protein